jgi:hypothetical protein
MNPHALSFFSQHYAPGRVCLVGCSDPIYKLIREGQQELTPDGKSSKWNHTFLMGSKRDDGRTDGSIYIFESDLHASVQDWEVKNGVMESRIVKWCRDDIEYAAVLGIDLSQSETDSLVRKALELAYDENHLRYPVGELFGTLWAIITGKLKKKNIFDIEYAVQCATFVRICYQSIQHDIVEGSVHLTNTTPETIYQSPVFSFRQEWHS